MTQRDFPSGGLDDQGKVPDAGVIEPIGSVRLSFATIAGTTLQSVAAVEVAGSVETRGEPAAGLRDLDGFSHIDLVTWLHRPAAPEGEDAA